MRSIVRGVVALFAAFCIMDVAKAAPTIVSPADYATVKTMTDEMHSFLYSDAMLDPDTFTYTQTEYIAEDDEYRYVVTDARKAYMAEYNSNTIPVVFEWSAATDHSGDYTVTVKRVKDGKTVFTQTTSSTTVTFYDPEVGRNYIWTVTDNTGSATGHFYTDRRGPRIIYSETSHLTNARDLGGWTTTDGKVVKQGLIYRAPEWEWSARQKTETGNYFEMPYLRDVLGIKLEVDLRAMSSKTGAGVTGQTYIDYFQCGSVYESTIDSSIPRFFCEHAVSTVAFPSYGDFNSSAANRKAIWHTFTNFCDVVKADGTTKPVIFHCSHGKDRTGSLAYVLLGVLGVPRDSLERDWALSWYSEGKYDVCMNKKGASKTPDTTNEWALDRLITAIDNNYSGATLKERCYNYLLACANNASVSEANAKALIDNYISIMLEEPETAAVNPDPNAPQPPEVEEPEVEVDEFVYTDYYFRGFGSFNEHYRWFKSLNDSSMCADGFSPISYKNRFYFQPTASTHHALGLYSRNATGDAAMKTGMIVCDASKQGSDGQVGMYDCAFYFSSEGHTVSERCIFEHRAGRSEWIGTHLYFVDPYNTSKSVYDGLASIDVWGGSTMCISGFISKTPNKTYLKFPADNCNNARVEVFYDDKENYSTLGWFTGGSESTKQYFQVTNAFMQFTTSGKVNGVAGALGLEFGLGALNKTTTDPLLKITGTFKVNPGSTITVNAGGKSAGTYKLISAGTLNDGADLVANSSVVNCASGHYGVVRKSGNAINLVIIKGTPPSTGDTVIDPTVYGSADTASSTYTWRGYTGPWAYTTNWTASASANYGIPNNGTYATADFPATLANAFTCTLDKNYSVKYAKFDAPNMTLVIDNAALTVKDRANPSDYLAYGFGTGENASATLEFRGASAGIVSSKSEGRCMFGLEKSATDKLRCTVRFIVPATGWENTAPIRATGGDCSVYFWYDAKLVIDATALGVPAEGAKKTVLLATASDYLANHAKVELTCAAGAKGTVAVVDDNKLVLTVEAGEIVEEPVLTAVDAPVAQTGLVYTGSELTGVESVAGYTLTGNTATDAGTYEATATLAEGYKWSDDTTADKSITWVIAKATNEWTIEPKIEPATWTEGEAAGVLTSGVAKFGTVTSSMAELPTTAGNYTITYTVIETTNYTGLTKEVSFTINAAAVDPDQPGGGDDTDDPVVIVPTINPEWGYVKTGLGAGGDEVAVVFTNHLDNAMTWTIPQTLKNVQFLVVGGGGGGGCCTSGPGGGGGGVVTGLVYSLNQGDSISVKVGGGGLGVGPKSTGAAQASKKGTNSWFKVNDALYITANGGGAGGSTQGGSGAGGRPKSEGGNATQGTVDPLASNLVFAQPFGNNGGSGTSASAYGGGGGGGATEAGGDATSKKGGKGGAGLLFDITGVPTTYGSGGGGTSNLSGATQGSSGDGAGIAGASTHAERCAKPNQGGGGGGASSNTQGALKTGGNGGSGIVVFRYGSANISVDSSEPEEPQLTAVDAPEAVADLVYTGSELTGVVAADGYTLTGNTATDARTYEATATLAEGYKWSDDTTEPKTISWSIAKVTNEWTTEPSISLETWTQGETAGVLTAGVAKFGEVTSSMTELPTAVGKYTITYTVVETDNYSGLTKEVSFEILKKPTSYDFTVGDVALTDGKLTFKGNFAIDGESEATETNLVVSVYDVAEGGDVLKTVTVEGIPVGEFNQEIDIAALELADGVYYLAFEVQDEAGNVLVAAEERSMLTIGETKAVKPTVNYASGTKFTVINGVVQKPVVTPADGNGYTVSYEGDFKAAGTHRIVIALKDGWTWSDGTSDTLTYEYEFIERTYTEYYIKTFKTSGADQGTFQSDSRWFTDSGFTSLMSTCPNVYDAHNIASIPANVLCQLLIDNAAGKVLTPKFGKFTVNGNFRIVTYSGGLMFQNDTATPMPIWEVESGVSTIDGVVFDVNGSGTGYIDIGANTTNVLGGVNYNSGFESSKKLFVRFSDEATAGSALRVHDFENWYVTNFGWFEGGAEGSTYALDIEEGVLSLNNSNAVSGVAGDLAITVKLGDKVGAANAYLNVAGTLNINEGSTLTVDANSMPCGVYTIINAATFNGADLLTSAAGATVTGLAEFTSGELVREGNKIVLYIETTIPPRVPGIEGDPVATNAVFETARVAKPIWYKTMPAINGDEIMFNRVTVKVPEYYDVTLETLADGYLVNLKLKDNLKAFIANKVENDQIVTPAIRIENEKVYIHLENTRSDLYYTLLKSTKLGAEAEWKPTEEYAIGKADFEYTPAEGEAETCFFKAGDVMDEPPAK